MVESIAREERGFIGKDVNGHFWEGNRHDEEVMGRCSVKENHLEGPMVNFTKKMERTVDNFYFQKREEHRVI